MPAKGINLMPEYVAVWDTGASLSLIRPEVVRELELVPVRQVYISGITGRETCSSVYAVHVRVSKDIYIPNIEVVEGKPTGCDMLIGMNIINLGDFAVSNFKGSTMFSFRIPSMEKIDFTREP
jgi:predicted aspartyl protease